MNMQKGDILEGKVLKTEFPNKGILYIEEKKVVVKNALEGQTIRFSVSKKRKDRVEGRLLEVLAPSPLETASQDRVWSAFRYLRRLRLPDASL